MQSQRVKNHPRGEEHNSLLDGSRSISRVRGVAPNVSHIVPESSANGNDLSRDKVTSRRRTARSVARSQDPRSRSLQRASSRNGGVEMSDSARAEQQRMAQARSPSVKTYGTFRGEDRTASSSRARHEGAPLQGNRPMNLPRSQYEKQCRNLMRCLQYTVTGVEVTFFHIRFLLQQCMQAQFVSILNIETEDSLSFLNFNAPKEWADQLFPTGLDMDTIPPILLTGSAIETEFSHIVASNSRFLFSNDATDSMYLDPSELSSLQNSLVSSGNITTFLPNTFVLDNHAYSYSSFSSFTPWTTGYMQCLSPSSMFLELVGSDQWQVKLPASKQSRLRQLKQDLSENALMETKYLSLYRPHGLDEAAQAFQKLLLLYGSVSLPQFNSSDIGQATLMNTHPQSKKTRPVYAQVHLDKFAQHTTWSDPVLLNTVLQWVKTEYNLKFLHVNQTIWASYVRSSAAGADSPVSARSRALVDLCRNNDACFLANGAPYPLPYLLSNSRNARDTAPSREEEQFPLNFAWQKLPMLTWKAGLNRQSQSEIFSNLKNTVLLNEAALPLELRHVKSEWTAEDTLVVLSHVQNIPLTSLDKHQGMSRHRRRHLAQIELKDTPLPPQTNFCTYVAQETNIPSSISGQGMRFGSQSFYNAQLENLPTLCAIPSSSPLAHAFMHKESQLYTFSPDNYIREKLHNATNPHNIILTPHFTSSEGDVVFPGEKPGTGLFQSRIQQFVSESTKHIHPSSDNMLVCVPCSTSYNIDPAELLQDSPEDDAPTTEITPTDMPSLTSVTKKYFKKVKKHNMDPNYQAHQNTTMYRKVRKLSPLYSTWAALSSKQQSIARKIAKKTKQPLESVLQHLQQGQMSMIGAEPAQSDPVKEKLKVKLHGTQWGRTSNNIGLIKEESTEVYKLEGSHSLFAELPSFSAKGDSLLGRDQLVSLMHSQSGVRSISLQQSLQNVQFVEGRRTCAQWDVQLSAFRTPYSNLQAGLAHRFQPCRIRSQRKKARRSSVAKNNLRDEATAQPHQTPVPLYAESGIVTDPLSEQDTVQVSRDTPLQYVLLAFICLISTVTLIWRLGSVLLTRQIDSLADIEKVLFYLGQNENVEDYLIVTGITETELRDTYINFVQRSGCLIINASEYPDLFFHKTTKYFCDSVKAVTHTRTVVPLNQDQKLNFLLLSQSASQEFLDLKFPGIPPSAFPVPTKLQVTSLPHLPSILRNLYYPKLGWLFYSYALQDIIVYTFLALYFVSNVANTGSNYDFSQALEAKAQTAVVSTNHSNAWLKLSFALFGWAAATLFVSFVTLFPYRYIVMSKAVAAAFPLLISFGVVMIPLAIAFVMFAYTAFHNYDDPRYLSIGLTATSLFAIMCGDNILESFTQ